MADASPTDASGEPPVREAPDAPLGLPARPGLRAARSKPLHGNPTVAADASPNAAAPPTREVEYPSWMVPPLGPVTTRALIMRLTVQLVILAATMAIAVAGFILIRQISGDDATRDWSFDLPEGQHLAIATGRGNIHIEGAPRAIAEIVADIQYADRVISDSDTLDNELSLNATIDDPLLTRWFGNFRPRADFAAVVSSAAPLDLRTGSGHLRIAGMKAGGTLHGHGSPVTLEDAAGDWTITGEGIDVQAARIAGSISIEATAGRITLDSVTGDTAIAVRDAHLDLRNLGGSVRASTTTGDITLTVAAGPVTLHTGSGDITAHVRIPDGTPNHVTTSDGNINLTLDLASNVAITVRAPGGTVTVNGETHGPQFAQTIGDGSATLEIVAEDGDVTLTLPPG